jgi:hypothetical protein
MYEDGRLAYWEISPDELEQADLPLSIFFDRKLQLVS